MDIFFIDHTTSNYSVQARLYSRILKDLNVLGNVRIAYHTATNCIAKRAVDFGMNALKNVAGKSLILDSH